MKYNLHQIMTTAWATYRKWAAPYRYNNSKVPEIYSFSRALKQAWADAKKTVDGSYDKHTKTIEVMTKTLRTFAKSARRVSVTAIRGLCPRCHTYCYGDCMAR